MAYASLVSLAQTLDPILLHDENSTPKEKQLIESLHENVSILQALLDDFPQQDGFLEGRIRDAANQAEDIIEGFMWEQLQSYHSSQMIKGFQNVKIPRNPSAMYMELRRNHNFENLYQELRKVTDEIDSIVQQTVTTKNSIKVEENQVTDSSGTGSSSRPEPTAKEVVVGLENDLMEINSRICGGSYELQVIPIVGMGGIGKTTLARKAYKDPLNVERFDFHAWVTVSQDYSIRDIFTSILVSLNAWKEELSEKGNAELVVRAYQCLKARRYLFVMDDMWSTKAWDEVKMIFPDDNNGSRIILTTRLEDVAAYADSSRSIHEMHFMGEDESWNLLREKVILHRRFPNESETIERDKLETIGRDIVKSCRGLPLAINVAAGLLATANPTEASWKNVLKSINTVGNRDEDQVEKILSLSYTNLPHYLRPCFLYLGGFPEDKVIPASKLVKLWVAEGFLKPSEGRSFEENARAYLEDLAKRSLVLVTERTISGKIRYCSIHDLLRDLCIRKGQEENFFLNATERQFQRIPERKTNPRRSSFCRGGVGFSTDSFDSTIRTILYFLDGLKLMLHLQGFRMLRVLDLPEISFMGFPPEVLTLFHLRYLALMIRYDYGSGCLPEDIGKLQKLQTLVFWSSLGFPFSMWRMKELRHINADTLSFTLPPFGNYVLKNLLTLRTLRNLKCTKRFLDIFPNIKKLGLHYDWSKEGTDCHLENLIHLTQLESLEITAGSLPGNLVFPATLKKLTLRRCGLQWQDIGVVSSLPNLEVLRSYGGFDGPAWETNEGEFPRLKLLDISETNLEYWVTESSHFPSLKHLTLYECPKLEEIPQDIGYIPTLELIEVKKQNSCLVDSVKRIEEEQKNMGNYALQVRILQ